MPQFDSRQFDSSSRGGGRSSTRTYSSLQALFLHRLSKLLSGRQDWSKRLPTDDWRVKLLNKAIYSTYCDCVEQGLSEDARDLLAKSRSSQS